jgi:hypothetical protein
MRGLSCQGYSITWRAAPFSLNFVFGLPVSILNDAAAIFMAGKFIGAFIRVTHPANEDEFADALAALDSAADELKSRVEPDVFSDMTRRIGEIAERIESAIANGELRFTNESAPPAAGITIH